MKYVRFTFEFIAVEWKKFFMRVFLMSVSLFLIQFSLLYYRGISYGYENCDKALVSGIDKAAYIRTEEDVFDSGFFKEAAKLEEIAAIGHIDDGGGPSDGVEELLQIQTGGDIGDGMLMTRSIHPTLLPICEMELKEGTPYWELDYSKPDTTYVYLGSDYEGIPVGTRYERIIDGRFYGYWEVAGIFPKGFRWIKDVRDSIGNIATLDYTEDCSNSIFLLENYFDAGAYLCAADGYSIEDAIAAIRELADSRGISFTYDTFSEMFEEGRWFADVLSGIIFKMFIICLLCGFFMIINFQSLSLIESGRDMGIMLSVGFSPAFLKKIYLIKDCIQGLLAGALSLSVSLMIARQLFIGDDMKYILINLCLKNLIPVSLLVVAAIAAVCSAITHIILKRMNPVRLIRRA